MSRIVVDCSITCCWLFADENDQKSDAVLREVGSYGAFEPDIWWAEIRNVLMISERRRRITPTETNTCLSMLRDLDIQLDAQPAEESLLALVRRHRLTVYDALYFELAARLDVPLATLDRALSRAAELERVPLSI